MHSRHYSIQLMCMHDNSIQATCAWTDTYMCVQVVMTANTFVWAYIGMPHDPHDDAAAKRVGAASLRDI